MAEMEYITLGQIAVGAAFLAALITSVTSIRKLIKDSINAALKERFDGLEKSNKEILKRLDTVDIENCKNYLITFLSEVSRGEPKDEIEIQRFWEEYEHYTSKGGNSYIHRRVEELKGAKKI